MFNLKSVMFAVVVSAFSAASAFAYDCTSLVADETTRLSGSVTSAIERIRAVGAEPRVRLIKTYSPFGNLDLYERDFLLNCPAMKSADGGKKTNLVTIIIEFEHRQVGLYYGQAYHDELDAHFESINDAIALHLGNGDFAAAVNAGLNSVSDKLVAPKAAPQPQVIIIEKPAEQRTEQIPAGPPPDLSWIGWFFAIVLVLALVLALILWLLNEEKKKRVLRHALTLVGTQRTACEMESQALAEALQGLHEQYERLKVLVASDDLSDLAKRIGSLQVSFRKAGKDFETLSYEGEKIARDDASGFRGLAEDYQSILTRLSSMQDDVNFAFGEITSLQQLVDGAATHIDRAKSAVDDATTAVGLVAKNGYKVDIQEAELKKAGEKLDAAKTARAEHKFRTMETLCGEVQKTASAASEAAGSLPKLREKLEKRLEDSVEMVPHVSALRGEARAAFERMQSTYAVSSWSQIRANGSTADAHLEDAVKAHVSAKGLIDLETQDWENGEKAIAYADDSLREAAELFEATLALERSIIASYERAPAEIKEAAADIAKAREFLAAYDADIDDSLEGDVKKAEALLEEAKAEHDKKKPNFLLVVKKALAANAAADRIFELASDQHEAMNRKRRLAKASLAEAQEAIDTTGRYIHNHRGDVRGGSGQSLAEAGSLLASAQAAQSLDSIIEYAKRANEIASQALSRARRNVSDAEAARRAVREAEEERQRAARRREDDARRTSTSYTSSSSSSSSPNFGGGGSQSFGGGSFGGGGSRGW